MIQVEKAWEYLKRFKDDAMEDVFFNVAVDSLSGNPRGIYIREANQCSVRHTFSIAVNPQWRRLDVATEEQQQQQINFEAKFVIETTAPDWVTVPSRFFLMNNGRSFKIDVDPTGLAPGLHTAQVIGVDASQSKRRVLFTVPITIAKPLDETLHLELGTLEFSSGEIKRFFAMPPPGCTWMDITITDKRNVESEGNSRLFSLHTIQLLPHASWRDFEYTQTYGLRPSRTVVASIALEAGIAVEICLARYWSTLGMSAIDVDVKFRGIRPVPNNLLMPACGAGHGAIVRATSDLADETISPAAKLSKWKSPLRPLADAVIKPLGERDVLAAPEKKIYQLLLTYEFNQEEKGSLTPRASAMQDCLYESGFEGQMIRVFDGDKKLLGTVDAFPSTITAPKGRVVVRMQIRHDNPEKLEKLKDMILWIERSMDTGIALKAYSSREAMILGKGTFQKQILRRGTSVAVWFAEPSFAELPSTCKAGDVLEGSFTLGSGEATLPGSGKRPGGFPITYVVGPKPEKPASDPAETPEPKDDRTAEEKLEEAIRDLKVAQLGKLTDKEKEDGKFEELYSKMLADYPEHLPLLMAKVKHLDSHKNRKDKLQEVISSATEVAKRISEDGKGDCHYLNLKHPNRVSPF
jgi:tripeptidyl-peptidase II